LLGFEKRINLIARILQVPAGSQNMKGLLIFLNFHIWPIAKSGYIFL
jgi:hypothetical protein